MKKPEGCKNMIEIRTEIDTIDKKIIALIAARYKYVKAAAKFKSSPTSVQAPERVAAMLSQRRQWAEEQNLNADVIEKMYADLVSYFITEELAYWKKQEE